ncbi:unnamed protein product [Chrysoparadoxa australica]
MLFFPSLSSFLSSLRTCNHVNSQGRSPLHEAIHQQAEREHPERVKDLLRRGADMDCKDREGETPMMLAVREGKEECVRALLSAGEYRGQRELKAVLEAANIWDETCLHLAASEGRLEMLNMLLEKGAPVNPQNDSGETPLMTAVVNGHESCARALMLAGADLEMVDVNGGTALHMCSVRGHLPCVRMLLKASANPNVKTKSKGDDPPAACRRFWGHNPALGLTDETMNSVLQELEGAQRWGRRWLAVMIQSRQGDRVLVDAMVKRIWEGEGSEQDEQLRVLMGWVVSLPSHGMQGMFRQIVSFL